ncbi:hypothetical protein RHMOL_Rhmol08G0159100 [Rhododendron molle]|uniref:Uncharacterized protein n=1 Tax=Rhododendron molle TaxID=49168 RepID=A0ACC0MQW8_RHOML|nr:hypothetical protein RHMOL_Rhmol08G0159100 [Rhododendron molle]
MWRKISPVQLNKLVRVKRPTKVIGRAVGPTRVPQTGSRFRGIHGKMGPAQLNKLEE